MAPAAALLTETLRVTCLLCEDVVPSSFSTRVDGVNYCRPCAASLMRADLEAISEELS